MLRLEGRMKYIVLVSNASGVRVRDKSDTKTGIFDAFVSAMEFGDVDNDTFNILVHEDGEWVDITYQFVMV